MAVEFAPACTEQEPVRRAGGGAAGASNCTHGLGDMIECTCSLGVLRSEVHAGFEALLAELGRHRDALDDVRMLVGGPARGAECAPSEHHQLSEQPCTFNSQSYNGRLEVVNISRLSIEKEGSQTGAVTPVSPLPGGGSSEVDWEPVPSRQSCRNSSRKSSHGSSVSEDWKEALDISMPASASVIIRSLGSKYLWLRQRVRRLLRHHMFKFDCFFGLVLAANSVTTGMEVQNSLDGNNDPALRKLEHIFLVLFVIELALRVLGDGTAGSRSGPYLWSGWFVLDATLVAIGVVGSWIVEPIVLSMDGDGDTVETMRKFILIRIFRLLRLARALRLLELFEDMWKLSNGLVTSFKTVISACIMIFMTIFIFACLGVEWIVTSSDLKADVVTNEIVQTRFNSLPRTMLTLLSFANADSIASIYEPMITEYPVLAPFFGGLWLCVTVSLMNLVTAVIVDTAIEQSRTSGELKRAEDRKKAKKLMPEVGKLFDNLDHDGDGTLDWREVTLEGIALPEHLREVISEDKLMDFFDYLDLDGSGTVDKDEFVDGVMHLAMQHVPIETTQALQLIRSNQKTLSEVHMDLQQVQKTLEPLIAATPLHPA